MNDYLPQADELKDRVILVTGATQGIGRAVAMDFASRGATIVLLARGARRLEAVYDEIVAAGYPEPAAIPLDLLTTTDEQFEQLALQIYKTVGRLDGIVHCAAYMYALSPLKDQRIEEWMNQFRINTVAPFALTRACLPLLTRSPDAAVVFVGETHGLKASPYWGAFSVSKSGLSHLTRIAADEWDMHPNLRVNLLVPGPVNSPQRVRTHPGQAKSELPNIETLLPAFCYWSGPASQGRSGEVVELNS